MSVKALINLVESSKATVLVGVLVVMGTLLYMKLITADQFLGTLKILVPAWMVSHAGERGAQAIAKNGGSAQNEGAPQAEAPENGSPEKEAPDQPGQGAEDEDESGV